MDMLLAVYCIKLCFVLRTIGPYVPKLCKCFTHWYRLLFKIFILALCRSKAKYEYFDAGVCCVGNGENGSILHETGVWYFVA
jgi:hypothetical protein